MKFLCRIGWHSWKWKPLQTTRYGEYVQAKVCRLCGRELIVPSAGF